MTTTVEINDSITSIIHSLEGLKAEVSQLMNTQQQTQKTTQISFSKKKNYSHVVGMVLKNEYGQNITLRSGAPQFISGLKFNPSVDKRIRLLRVEYVQDLLKEQQKTWSDLSLDCGFDKASVKDWCNHKSGMLKENIEKIAKFFQVTSDTLVVEFDRNTLFAL